MKEYEFQEKLKQHPCPKCKAVGMLRTETAEVKATFEGSAVYAKGEVTVCDACNAKFLSTEVTESLASQIYRLQNPEENRHLQFNKSGELETRYLN